MKSKPKNPGQTNFLYQRLEDQLDPKHPLYRLAEKIDRDSLDQGFEGFYGKKGRPAHPVRLTASLLMLKQMYDASDEDVVDRWTENPYWRFFSGTETFQWKFPVEPSDPTRFRKRIGKKGAEKILKLSIDIRERKASDKEIPVDTTVQEKNIARPDGPEAVQKIHRSLRADRGKRRRGASPNLQTGNQKPFADRELAKNIQAKKAARKARKKLKTVGVSANSYESSLTAKSNPTRRPYERPSGAEPKARRQKQTLLSSRTRGSVYRQRQGA